MFIAYACCLEKIGDELHGLGEDRGCTSKPDFVWEEIGDILHGLGEDRGCTSKPVNV